MRLARNKQRASREALQFLDQSLDAGFRPGMGHVIPDRFFWALPPEDEQAAEGAPEPNPPGPTPSFPDEPPAAPGGRRRVH